MTPMKDPGTGPIDAVVLQVEGSVERNTTDWENIDVPAASTVELARTKSSDRAWESMKDRVVL